jgi:group I intron endonuclease
LNGKSYVGSSINLGRRIREYYNISHLEINIKRSSSMIYRSLLKYGYSNFSLEILEYVAIDKLLSREQYYIDTLQPSYNILLIAGSPLGRKCSPETIEKLKRRS